uniref:Uncharacterized protein n=1 Tax=Timema genevievae TaxID=629358 RepID=A0A7R9JX68_TIMGE|nr:unnamed protein product [Timema genevievae]
MMVQDKDESNSVNIRTSSSYDNHSDRQIPGVGDLRKMWESGQLERLRIKWWATVKTNCPEKYLTSMDMEQVSAVFMCLLIGTQGGGKEYSVGDVLLEAFDCHVAHLLSELHPTSRPFLQSPDVVDVVHVSPIRGKERLDTTRPLAAAVRTYVGSVKLPRGAVMFA